MEKTGMGPEDEILGALCAWRENRSGRRAGMQSVLNVLMNRAAQRKTSVYTEAVRPLQFSSMTAKGDPNLIEYPLATDPQWAMALILAGQMVNGSLQDITQGSTSYYAASMAEPPYWAASMTQTVTIEGQIFFKT
jgi:spore germination cell wall hydrolase CwlJ-like protein